MKKVVDGKKAPLSVSSRIEYIDLLRGIGIILMTIGHVGFTVDIEKWIYSFHMPLFYFISGYFFKDIKLDRAIKKLARTLLLPYIVWGMIYYFLYVIKEYVGGRQPTFLPLWHLLFVNTDGLAISPALWFFTSLFLTQIIYLLLNQLIKKRNFLTCIIVITMLCGMMLPTLSAYRLPWAMDTAFVGLGFYHVARVWRERGQKACILKKIDKLGFFPTIIFLFVFSMLVLMNEYINMRRGLYIHIPIFIIGSFGLILTLWNTCKMTETYVRGGGEACFTYSKRYWKQFYHICLS